MFIVISTMTYWVTAAMIPGRCGDQPGSNRQCPPHPNPRGCSWSKVSLRPLLDQDQVGLRPLLDQEQVGLRPLLDQDLVGLLSL